MLSEDDVIDFMVMEAVSIKVNRQEHEDEKAAERSAWKDTKNKDNYSNLDKFR